MSKNAREYFSLNNLEKKWRILSIAVAFILIVASIYRLSVYANRFYFWEIFPSNPFAKGSGDAQIYAVYPSASSIKLLSKKFALSSVKLGDSIGRSSSEMYLREFLIEYLYPVKIDQGSKFVFETKSIDRSFDCSFEDSKNDISLYVC